MVEDINEKETIQLKNDLEKVRSQFYMFYELTKAMRTTLHLEEIVYIILTGLTAQQGLAFNRAIIFLVDKEGKNINGFMGIGPIDGQEATDVWQSIKNQQLDLYSLIKAYQRMKQDKKPRFMEFIQSLSFPLNEKSGLIYSSLSKPTASLIKESKTDTSETDPLIHHLRLKDFVISSIWAQDKPIGIILADNYITKKPITEDDIRIFSMFVDQAQGAIENSQAFEITLLKSHTDSLTGLWNYGYFQYRLDDLLTQAKLKKQPLSVMMLDLDDFKKFNDKFGHLEGDKALRKICNILKVNCRKDDIICRYGGEEFSIILPQSGEKDAQLLGERIRKSVEEELILDAPFTVSIGIACYLDNDDEKRDLIKKADDALYEAKRNGKNQVILAK
ncbi:MAG: diguanylate cyclase [Candidatus Omnitrophica bacterium]|nr:diguanylate cyclase [Candidatus Omnitrophota bacterium]